MFDALRHHGHRPWPSSGQLASCPSNIVHNTVTDYERGAKTLLVCHLLGVGHQCTGNARHVLQPPRTAGHQCLPALGPVVRLGVAKFIHRTPATSGDLFQAFCQPPEILGGDPVATRGMNDQSGHSCSRVERRRYSSSHSFSTRRTRATMWSRLTVASSSSRLAWTLLGPAQLDTSGRAHHEWRRAAHSASADSTARHTVAIRESSDTAVRVAGRRILPKKPHHTESFLCTRHHVGQRANTARIEESVNPRG